MTDQPLVSVIMPTYNHGQFIAQSIESVLNQTYLSIELIVIDNESEDNTRQIVESYKDQRVKYVQLKRDGTIAAPRNYGIREANGEYIAFLDSDDLWHPSKLESQLHVLSQDPLLGISFTKFKVICDNDMDQGKCLGPRVEELPNPLYERLLKANYIVTSSVVVRRKVLDEVGCFDEDPKLRCTEDFDLWLRIIRKFKPAFVNKVLGEYRMHDTNQSDHEEKINRVIAVIDKHLEQGWITPLLADKARASFYFQVGWTTVDRNPKEARSYFHKAYKLDATNPKMICVSSLGLVMTFVPAIYRLIRRNKIDKKIGRRTINPQNL